MKSYCLTNYTVQCKDQTSGKTGCFLFDVAKWQEMGLFYALGEVYPDLDTFYRGTSPDSRKSIYVERDEEIAVIVAECPTCGKPSAALSDSEGVEPLECFNCTTKGIKS